VGIIENRTLARSSFRVEKLCGFLNHVAISTRRDLPRDWGTPIRWLACVIGEAGGQSRGTSVSLQSVGSVGFGECLHWRQQLNQK
jgi:hypothetical protein